MERPFSPSCERNREPIFDVLRDHLPASGLLLEIGSGTGQHGAYFAPSFPGITWQTSDRAEHHDGIRAWVEWASAPNLRPPLPLDVNDDPWPLASCQAVFTANTTHYMAWPSAQALLRGVARVLTPGGRFVLYGPFNYGGRFTSESNARFDLWLKERDPSFGVRDAEAVVGILDAGGLTLLEDRAMPANNRCMVFERG